MYILLILSFCSLFAGPILLQLATKKNFSLKFLDAFVLFSVVGLISFHVLPESYEEVGLLALLFALVGFLGPILYEKAQKEKDCRVHKSLVSVAFLGLIAHSALDGFALFNSGSLKHATGKIMLGLAVVLHRIPEGVAIWRFTMKQGNKNFAIATVLTVTGATLAGFFFGSQFISHASEDVLMLFQALMAGALLHIIFHHEGHEAHKHKSCFLHPQKSSVFGAILGILVVAGITLLEPVFHEHEHEHAHNHSHSEHVAHLNSP